MSGENPFDGDNPFGGMPFFGDFARMLGGGGGGWEGARQMAMAMASGNENEPNVDPAERIAYEQIARVAELQVVEATGLAISPTGTLTIRPATRREWAGATIDQYKPILERIGQSLGSAMTSEVDVSDDPAFDANDPGAAMLQGIMGMMAPMMVSMTAGSMVGHLAQRSLGFHDLPIPRGEIDEIIVIHTNVAAFVDEWSLPADDVRLWISLNEYIHRAVLRLPHVSAHMTDLLHSYTGAFAPDPTALEDRLGNLGNINPADPSSITDLQASLGDPDMILGAMQSDRQRELLPYLEAIVAVVEGYADHIMDTVGGRLIGSYGQLSEALRRRRVAADPSDRFVERMLGLQLDQDIYDRGQAFVGGVVERAGDAGLNRLWASERTIPTPSELEAPGLWLARIDLPEGLDEAPEAD